MHTSGGDRDLSGVHELDHPPHSRGLQSALGAPALQLHSGRLGLGEVSAQQQGEVVRRRGQHRAVGGQRLDPHPAGPALTPGAELQRHVAEQPRLPLLVLPPGELGAVGRAGELLGLLRFPVTC